MSRTVLAAAATAVLIALAVIVVRMATSQPAEGARPTPADTGIPASPTAHRVATPTPAEDYWTDERMRRASPAPAPVQTE
ncbi:hypothetical protein GCM10020216_056670 [Nonomuraea helvata]